MDYALMWAQLKEAIEANLSDAQLEIKSGHSADVVVFHQGQENGLTIALDNMKQLEELFS